ncbi:MAG: hypothetical protein ABIO92_04340 [Chloroflexia bacterium]
MKVTTATIATPIMAFMMLALGISASKVPTLGLVTAFIQDWGRCDISLEPPPLGVMDVMGGGLYPPPVGAGGGVYPPSADGGGGEYPPPGDAGGGVYPLSGGVLELPSGGGGW